jgi:sugar phosphate isomerase/epimerase
MKVSVITDEVSSDPETALELVASWGVKFVEIRGIGEHRFPRVTDYWKYRLPQLVDEFGLKVVAISPGLFQTPPPGVPRRPMAFSRAGDMRIVRDELETEARRDRDLNELLPASIEAALRLEAESIICFSFFSRSDHTEGDPLPDDAVQVMRYAAEKVAAAGLKLNVEVSEPSLRCADLVRRVDHPAFGVNWDPGAAYMGGEDAPYPDGYAQLRGYVRHVHFKDVRMSPASGAREVVVDGVIDWPAALRALLADGFEGWMSVETHRRPKVDSTYRMLRRLQAMAAATEAGLREAATEPGHLAPELAH